MEPIHPAEGWLVLHLFYRIDRRAWRELSERETRQPRERLRGLVEEFRRHEKCQIYTYAVVGHKADFGVLMVDPELHHLNSAQNRIFQVFPAGTLEPAYSYLSMSEVSEYMTQDRDYDRTLREKEGLEPGSPEYERKMGAFRERMKVYVDERLYPKVPPHRVMCFYPMNKARGETKNWYSLDFETRKQLMSSHAVSGRRYAGKVRQLVTGSTGLDAWEWGVTLFADDPVYLKKIVYEMRFDEVSAVYGQFGDFIVGICLEPEELLDRLQL